METLETTGPGNETEVKGYLNQVLSRTNREIRQQRGDAIAEDLELAYRRKIEDLETDITRAKRNQDNAFDFSPTNTQSLLLKSVDALEIMKSDLDISYDVRNKYIQLQLAKQRYNYLFGFKYEVDEDGLRQI